MGEINADMDKAAASYWQNVASKAGPEKSAAALSQASQLLSEARAETRIPDSSKQPTLDTYEAPPMDVLRSGPKMTK